MKNRDLNRQIVVSGILIFAVLFGTLPIYAQTKQDDKGVGLKIVSALPSRDKRWALIVGIDEYQNDVSTLRGSVNDAEALKNVLVNNAGFPENQIILLTTDSTEQDKRPTRENILGALSDLYSRVPEDGLLLFSFSGHGISVGNQAFLIPSNGRFTKNLTLLRNFSIDVSIIKEAIQEIKVKQVLMLLDACRNDPGKGDTPNILTNAYKNGFSFDVANSDVKAFATLYATSVGERAFEFYDKDTKQFRGYFSYAVEEALQGKAANEKGEVTLSRLIDHLETTVPKKVKYDKGETQIPTANYSETYRANQLILAVADKRENNFVPSLSSSSSSKMTWNNFRVTAKNLLKYNYIGEFHDGLAVVNLREKYGFINKNGQEVISPTYDEVDSFSEGFAPVELGDKYFLIDTRGKIVASLKYDIVKSFKEGVAEVRLKGQEGFIDKTGKEVVPTKYGVVYPFAEGLAVVTLDNKYGAIDKTGREIIPLKYDLIRPFSEGLAHAKLDGKFGFIDKSGNEVIPFKYFYVDSFSEGLAMVYFNGRYGAIDRSGKEVIAFKYNWLFKFSEGIAVVELNKKYGAIDKIGREIIPFKYDFLYSFSEGVAEVRLNDKSGFIDKNGREIIPIKYDRIWISSFKKDGFIGVELNGMKGFVDLYGNEYFDF